MPNPLHPIVVHLPVALAVLMPLAALGAFVAVRRAWVPPRAGWWVVGLQALLVGTAVLALLSGEADEERVERLVSEAMIESHAQAATVFTWAAAAVLAVATAAMVGWSERVRGVLRAATVLGTAVVLALGFDVGRKGGDLVYRHGAARAFTRVAPNGAVANDMPPTGSDTDDD